MTKDNKCSSKQPCNSSPDNSEVCYKVKCEKKCCEKDCCVEQCEGYKPEELVCLFKDAVVEIHSEFILLGTGPTGSVVGPISSATGGTPLGPGTRTDVILEGNGFFIKGHYIVAPAQLVLLPPSLTSVVNRYPFLNPTDLTLGRIRNEVVRASRILVSVFNVNGKGHSFVYEANLVGVDGAGDIAVLNINFGKQFNLCNPCIEKCHPFFKFGSSRSEKDGEKVYLLGDYVSNRYDRRLFNAVGAISDGLLSDHRYLDYSGFALAESVLVSAPAYAFSAGLPILNAQGQVIGMQTSDLAAVVPQILTNTTVVGTTGAFIGIGAGVGLTGDVAVSGVATINVGFGGVTGVTGNPTELGTGSFGGTGTISGTGPLSTGSTLPITVAGIVGSLGVLSGGTALNQSEGAGLVAGPSEFFLRRVVKALIRGTTSREFNPLVETINDPIGAYYRYRKAYAGIAYDVFTGIDYDITVDYTSGAVGAGFPRVRLSAQGDFLNSPSCKELIGIRVLGLAGLNPNDALGVVNGFWYVPGGTGASPLPASLPNSPFLGKLFPGDVITHFGKIALGDLNKQIAPALFTWRLRGGDILDIVYRRGGNAGNTADNGITDNYDNLYSFSAALSDYPPGLDYPWYAVNIFPLLVERGFNFPFNQITNPQFPSLQVGAPFHPSL